MFDETARRKYVTGFKKRKDERREIAQRALEEKARHAKIEERRERRQALKFALSGGIVNRSAEAVPSEAPITAVSKAGGAKGATPAVGPAMHTQQVFQNTLATTTVTPLASTSDVTIALHKAESKKRKASAEAAGAGARAPSGKQARAKQTAPRSKPHPSGRSQSGSGRGRGGHGGAKRGGGRQKGKAGGVKSKRDKAAHARGRR